MWDAIFSVRTMGTSALTDRLFDRLSSPIQKAENAVKDDDANLLRPLLALPNSLDGSSAFITEDNFINPQAQENLLHFAVHQSSAQCVALLTNPPFSWDPDRPNIFGRTPLQLAAVRGYLPVWYPLAAHSKQSNSVKVPSVAAMLTDPITCGNSPLNMSDIVSWDGTSCYPCQLITVLSRNGDVSLMLSAQNLALLLELLLSAPHKLSGQNIWKVLSSFPDVGTHDSACNDYPMCLWKCYTSDVTNVELQWSTLLKVWAVHRLRLGVELNDVQNKPHQSSNNLYIWGPLRLMDLCRIQIRCLSLTILFNQEKLSMENTIKQTTQQYLTYASLIAQLPISPRLHAYLAYRELWPSWDRHLVPPGYITKRPREIYYPRNRLIPLHDPWFNVFD